MNNLFCVSLSSRGAIVYYVSPTRHGVTLATVRLDTVWYWPQSDSTRCDTGHSQTRHGVILAHSDSTLCETGTVRLDTVWYWPQSGSLQNHTAKKTHSQATKFSSWRNKCFFLVTKKIIFIHKTFTTLRLILRSRVEDWRLRVKGWSVSPGWSYLWGSSSPSWLIWWSVSPGWSYLWGSSSPSWLIWPLWPSVWPPPPSGWLAGSFLLPEFIVQILKIFLYKL